MLGNIIFCILMLTLPAVLWIIPKTRRNNGNWLVALKTASPGVLVGYWISWPLSKISFVLSEWQEKDIAIPDWIKFSIEIVVPLLFVVLLGIFIKRKFGDGKRYDPIPSILLFFVMLPPAVVAGCAIDIASYSLAPGSYEDEWRSAWLPPEGDTRIVFQQQLLHPFLAEYKYRIRFSRDGKDLYQLLFINCGGRTHFNLYRLKDGRLMFRDKDWDYLIDAPKQQVFLLKNFEGKLYALRVPNEEINSWSGGCMWGNGEVVMRLNDHRVTGEDVSGILDGMTYYGCILTKFHPAAQKPETKIVKTEERFPAPSDRQ